MAQQKLDPITLQVISGAPDTIAEEMGHIRYRLSFSSITRESQDLRAGLFDTDFSKLSESESTPLHIGSLPGYPEGLQETHHRDKWNDGDYEQRDDVMPGVGRFRGRLGGGEEAAHPTDGFITYECDRHEPARRRRELRPPPPPQRRRHQGAGRDEVERHASAAHGHVERQREPVPGSTDRDRIGDGVPVVCRGDAGCGEPGFHLGNLLETCRQTSHMIRGIPYSNCTRS